MSLLPAVTSVNAALYSAGLLATAYSSGLTKPTPLRVAACYRQVGEAFTSARVAAMIGVAEEVPPVVCQPPNASW